MQGDLNRFVAGCKQEARFFRTASECSVIERGTRNASDSVRTPLESLYSEWDLSLRGI